MFPESQRKRAENGQIRIFSVALEAIHVTVPLVIQIKHRVKEFRMDSKMSKAALARRIGAVRSYITKLESGQLQPSGPLMLRLAHVLQKPVEEIFQLAEQAIGKAAFRSISQRASVRAGELPNTAEIKKSEDIKSV